MLNEKLNIHSIIKILQKNSDKPLIHELKDNKIISYSVFLSKSLEFLYFLQNKKKLKERDKIIIKLENSSEYLISIFACFLGKFIACPIDKEIPNIKYKKIKKILNAKYVIDSLKSKISQN